MKKQRIIYITMLIVLSLIGTTGGQGAYASDVLKMVIMVSQDATKEASKWTALSDYLVKNVEGVGDIELETAKDYPTAVGMFQAGQVDGMFAGSFVAAVFIKKGVAVPVVCPVSNEGISTYKAVIVAPEGTPQFRDVSDIEGKAVAYCAFASSGEAFARGLIHGDEPEKYFTPMIMRSHGVAVRAVMVGDADVAIVKNLVYKDGSAFPGTVVIGSDSAENPNNALILTPQAYKKYGGAIEKSLTAVEYNDTQEAISLKKVLGIKGFKKTTENDFLHTYKILKKSHVDAKTFDFKW